MLFNHGRRTEARARDFVLTDLSSWVTDSEEVGRRRVSGEERESEVPLEGRPSV